MIATPVVTKGNRIQDGPVLLNSEESRRLIVFETLN
jgi:hypothetical protein